MAFGKALIQNTANRILNTIVMFLATVFLTRIVGVSDFGLLTLMITNASLLNLISSFGISSGITYNLAATNISGTKVVSVTILLLLTQLLFTSIFEYGCFQLDDSFWLFKGKSLTDFLLGISFFISISAIEKYNALLYGKQQYLLANNIVLAGNLVMLFCLIILAIWKVEDHYIFLGVYIVGNLFQAFALICTYHIIYKEPVLFAVLNKAEFKLFFSYSFLAFVTNCLQFIAYRADYWLVDYYKGSTQLGLYSVSTRFAQLFWIIPNLFAAIIFPNVAGKQTGKNAQSIFGLIRIMNTCNVIAGLFLFLFSPYLIVQIFGVEYANCIIPFRILLPGVITFCIPAILASYFAGINKLIVNFWGTILCLLVILILDFALIPKFGIKGAAIASSIGYALTTIYVLIVFNRLSKAGFNQLLILKKEDLVYLKRLLLTHVKA
ncbi:oligosaccharide flippase family protein [Chitinophagaceae bacterium LB-8]|uniref:Oligosaccharide flippase family protein n=1 Tax=Paraflavisolibacter caeni TaxID=2982496 RepID=A0A9X3BIQ0_9BACT|nr:oligosaccharide flippase family protein [Paraflavisolibacter caeni]MCU7550283.1 oligosaccharide flippase family protein [Paraflavisolibacter caeni]